MTITPNATTFIPTTPRPSCTFVPQEPFLPFLSDNVLAIILPTIVYAVAGGFFHLLDSCSLFSYWRIHPSEEDIKRNHVTRWQCLLTVIRYHLMQISIGLLMNHLAGNKPTMTGDEMCRIHRAADAISYTRNLVPMALNIVGIDAGRVGIAMEGTSAGLAQVLAGDYLSSERTQGFTAFELSLAKFVVSVGVPMLQFFVALAVVDTWIYFTHRLCHINKTLYRKPLCLSAIHNQFHVVHILHRHRPRPTSPALRLLRLRRCLRPLARNSFLRYPQLRLGRGNSTALGAAEYALRLVCDHQDD